MGPPQGSFVDWTATRAVALPRTQAGLWRELCGTSTSNNGWWSPSSIDTPLRAWLYAAGQRENHGIGWDESPLSSFGLKRLDFAVGADLESHRRREDRRGVCGDFGDRRREETRQVFTLKFTVVFPLVSILVFTLVSSIYPS